MTALQVLQNHVGPCREWLESHERCSKPSEYVLWGRLIPSDGLGPRCYDHAAKWVGHDALRPRSGHALINLDELARKLES